MSVVQLKSAGKTSRITGFNDQSISDGVVVIDLVDSIKRGSVNYDMVKKASTEQVSDSIKRGSVNYDMVKKASTEQVSDSIKRGSVMTW